MTIDADDEILQDFLVEAGEILEQLNEQLVELEQTPEDADLLNSVFRGFHTVKGGAGFLNLTNMVDLCHRAEDVFNLLRQGERFLDAPTMDVFLQVLDVLNEQFATLNGGEEPHAAPAELLTTLERLVEGDVPAAPDTDAAAEAGPTPAEAVPEETAAEEAAAADDDITDEEFDALLDAMQDEEPPAAAGEAESAGAGDRPAEGSDEITDEEFEKLLDELHGEGRFKAGVPADGAGTAAGAGEASDEITDEEFEKLLDELHGEGRFDPGAVKGTTSSGGEAASSSSGAEVPSPPAGGDAAPAEPAEKKPAPAATATKQTPQVKPAEGRGKEKKAARPTGEATVRVDTRRLDDIMNMVGELVLVRNRLHTLKTALGDEEISKAVASLDLVTADLQVAVMKTRMQPIKKVFGRFPRVVRDLARSLKKEVELVLEGADTDLDKNLVEALADPLIHLVRNAVDHGIESPEERERKGKPRTGRVVLSAAQEGDHILLTIEDDGAGMDPEKLRAKAVEKGLMDEEVARRLDERDCYNLIFHPGFSTKEQISDVSGRGVGMDVVKTRIAQLNGTIDIDSRAGKGSVISIKLPLTLAIMPTLMVKVGERTFALPLSSVSEIFHLDAARTNVVDGQLVVLVREKAMPLFYLQQWLLPGGDAECDPETQQVVVTQFGNQRVGFVVNQVVGQEEVVIKPLGAMLHGLPGFAGATITGDGRIALILDVPSLMRAYARRY